MARPALRAGILTVCPSIGVRGDWWSAAGGQIVEDTLARLRARGVTRIYLAGISNGGVGVSRLAPVLHDQLAGLILISGADPDAPPPPLPVVLLHGAQDERMPAELMAQYAAAAAYCAETHVVDGDHFVLLTRADELQAVIADWLARQDAVPIGIAEGDGPDAAPVWTAVSCRHGGDRARLPDNVGARAQGYPVSWSPRRSHRGVQETTTMRWRFAPTPKASSIVRHVLGISGGAVVALVALGHSLNWRRAPRTQADAALVFGCGEGWKRAARCATAAAVYHRGMVRWLVVSGGVVVPGTGQTEAAWFRDTLVARGVPAERILLEDRATNTAENVAYALPILKRRGFTRVVLVMSDFEGIRAHLTATRAWQGQGITIYDWHAPSPGHWSAWTWWLSREGWSLTCYTVPRLFRYRLLRYLWHPVED